MHAIHLPVSSLVVAANHKQALRGVVFSNNQGGHCCIHCMHQLLVRKRSGPFWTWHQGRVDNPLSDCHIVHWRWQPALGSLDMLGL